MKTTNQTKNAKSKPPVGLKLEVVAVDPRATNMIAPGLMYNKI